MAHVPNVVGLPGQGLRQSGGWCAATVQHARLFPLWHPGEENTVGTDACVSKVWVSAGPRPQLRRHHSEQGGGPAGARYRGASRKVTLGERGASTHHGRLPCASPLAEPRIPGALALGVSNRRKRQNGRTE